jgi:protoporphyrinogen oxidase
LLYALFFESYTEKLWGRHPREIAADWGKQRVKGLSIAAVLKDMFGKLLPKANRKVETSLIESFHYPKHGPGQLWECVAEDFTNAGGELLFGKTVTNFEVADGKITAALCGTQRYEADVFVSSVPLNELTLGLPNLPNEIERIAAGLPYRDFITVGVLVKKLKLKNQTSIPTLNNIVPDCWIYIQDRGVKLGRVQIFNNWSPYMVRDPEHTVWIGLEYFCSVGDELWNMTDADCVAFAVGELTEIGIIETGAEILDNRRECVKKAYPAYFDTYAEIGKLTRYLDTFPNLWCVGRNGQHRYNNMDHSMLTAFYAADAILAGTTDKKAVWNVNTEEDYHEEKHN